MSTSQKSPVTVEIEKFVKMFLDKQTTIQSCFSLRQLIDSISTVLHKLCLQLKLLYGYIFLDLTTLNDNCGFSSGRQCDAFEFLEFT